MPDVHDRGNPLSLTVILPTYNAITHLEEMLDSLRLQTLQPDEVRIFDDCSTDDTVEAIENYIEYYNLDSWFLYKNKQNKGWINTNKFSPFMEMQELFGKTIGIIGLPLICGKILFLPYFLVTKLFFLTLLFKVSTSLKFL